MDFQDFIKIEFWWRPIFEILNVHKLKHSKFGPDRFSRFAEVYWIQTNIWKQKKHQSNIVCYIWEYENMRIPRKIIYKNLDWMSPHLQTLGGKLDFSNDFCLLYLIYFSTVSTVFVKKNIFYSSIYISISLGLLHDICLYWFFMRKMFIFSLQLSLKSWKSWNKLLKI